MCVRYAGQLFADTVAKVENRSARDVSAAASLFSATGKVRGRFWMKRYGPPRRRAQNAQRL